MQPLYGHVVEIDGMKAFLGSPAAVGGRKPFIFGQTLSPRALPCQKHSGQSPPLRERSHRRLRKRLKVRACQDVTGLAIAGEIPGRKAGQVDRLCLEAFGEDGCQLPGARIR